MKGQLLRALFAARANTTPAALISQLDTGIQSVLVGSTVEGDLPLARDTIELAHAALAADRNGFIETSQGQLFVECWNPPLRLIIVGAVHIAQSLVPMAKLAGYEVTVVDPRTRFATAERFPATALLTDWPDEAVEALRLDARSALVSLTHDPKLDDPALIAALRTPCFYIGALGSRRTHAKRVERLREAGFGDNDIARIRAPVGLAIGGVSQPEISISIMAELTAVLRRAPLGERKPS
jgi:xanthine dehydrogenase accessory factor